MSAFAKLLREAFSRDAEEIADVLASELTDAEVRVFVAAIHRTRCLACGSDCDCSCSEMVDEAKRRVGERAEDFGDDDLSEGAEVRS